MTNRWPFVATLALVATSGALTAVGCSSSSGSDSGSGQDAATATDADAGGTASDSGSGSETGSGVRDGSTILDAGSTGFGAACTGPAGSASNCTDAVFNICEMVGPSLVCTKTCTYPGGGGPQPDPTDCPSPTSGDCTPKGFCK